MIDNENGSPIFVTIRSGAVWRFEPSSRYGKYVYTTKKNVYAVFTSGDYLYYPFMVGRLYNNKSWVNWTRELGVKKVVFPSGSVWYPEWEVNHAGA